MNRSAGTAVVVREAVRASRRWQTYALRFAFGFFLFAIVVWAWAARVESILDDPAAAARLGNMLFRLYTGTQLMMVAVVAPVVVGQAIAEEREDGTLELLTLTRLSATQILWSKLASRLVIIASVVASSLPLLSITLTFGGVGVWEAVNAVSVTLLIVLLFGSIGGFAALTARGGLAGLLSAGGYAATVLFMGPMMFLGAHAAVAGRRIRDVSPAFSPFTAFTSDDPEALLVWWVFLPSIAGVSVLAAPVFRMATSDDSESEFGLLSPDIWKIERFKRWTLMVGVAWLFGTLMMGLTSKLIPASVWWVLQMIQAAGFTFVLTVVWVFAFQLAAWWVSGLMVTHSKEVSFDDGRPMRRFERALRGRVWTNPVAWREVATRGQGPGTLLGRLGVPLALAVGFPVLVCADFDDDMFVLLGTGVVFGGLVATALAGAGALVPERRSGTLALLATTTMDAGAVVRGKVLAVGVHGLPLLGLGSALLYAGNVWPYGSAYRYQSACPISSLAVAESALVEKALMGGLWVFVVWLAISAAVLVASARLRPAGMGWGAALLIALAYLPMPPMITLLLFEREARPWVEIWLPFMTRGTPYAACLPGPEWMLSLVLHAAIAVPLLAVLTLRLRPWITSESR